MSNPKPNDGAKELAIIESLAKHFARFDGYEVIELADQPDWQIGHRDTNGAFIPSHTLTPDSYRWQARRFLSTLDLLKEAGRV